MARRAQQSGGALAALDAERLGQLLLGAAPQEAAQQRMQLVDAAFIGGHLGDEIVVEREVEEQARRFRLAGERLGHRRGHARQAGDAQQELLRFRLEVVEDLAGEVVEDRLRRRIVGQLGHAPRELGVLEHQHDARGPALRALVQLRSRLGRERMPAHLGEFGKLAGVEVQAFGADADHLAGDAQPRKRGGRLAAARYHHAAVLRDLAEGGLEHGMQRRIQRDAVQVVEHQRHGHLGARKKLAEELARERSDVGAKLRAERRQLARTAAFQLARRVAEVMEERGDVGIVGVDLVPEHLEAARLEVARREAGFARSRRPRDPADRAPRHAVEPGEQPLARHDRADRRARGLGERGLRMDFAHPGSIPPGRLQMAYRRQRPRATPSRRGSAPPRQPPGRRSMPCRPLSSSERRTSCPRSANAGTSAS